MNRLAKTRDIRPGERLLRELYLPGIGTYPVKIRSLSNAATCAPFRSHPSFLRPYSPSLHASLPGTLKILLIQERNGEYRALDAHCHHMGASLVEADIEELPTGNCLVCPWHKKKIDMRTGCVVDTSLSGELCLGHDQQQRTYDVHHDDENIFVSIPAFSKELPSDRWNPREQAGYGMLNGGLGGYGLNGTLNELAPPPGSPLQPFAGQRGWPAGSPAPMAMEEDAFIVQGSQQSPISASTTQPRRLDFNMSGPASNIGGLSGFGASRRNRAATEAIMKNAYRAPTGDRTNALQVGGKVEQRQASGSTGRSQQRSIRDFLV